MGRELSDKFKISVRSVGEVVEIFGGIVSRLRTKETQFMGKRVTREAVASALFLYLGTLSESEQERVVEIGLGELERMLKGEDPATRAVTGPAEEAPVKPIVRPTGASKRRSKDA